MKVFVSGQLEEKEAVRQAYGILAEHGFSVTHDWTRTDNLVDYKVDTAEAGRRAAKDIDGVLAADVYVLLSDNRKPGKGMYVELGAALAMREKLGAPEIFVVGQMNHESIFYHHPLVTQIDSMAECVDRLTSIDGALPALA